ncbi:DUF3052 domain-containing protein [Devosia sp. J2-20]|jgi:hypothetical protein|uniref:DUF3052 domain-containing protein n=1 Tax=Devosia litorisediminis TaxID=2829817 RepID=A0A942E8X9_9HYPH|nr:MULTISPECIES: DUF3052 domain-containing protein [Devosia]MBS3850278.1 DUF3052 domain-containing protein [Devosia litorisediminis]WDR00033.1 DUF3052 domain-containing protein [Devosia sp. J2-20]|tara:strand:+ start:22486 stop:22917 length:432 start_codon:yes stop_codon:yes gene_type:complete
MTHAAGYSGTPLAQKLGLKDGQRVLFIDLPDAATNLLTVRDFGEVSQRAASDLDGATPGYDVIHLFTTARAVLEDLAQRLMDLMARNGMLWVSWPKKAAKVATDITEDVIRDVLLPLGLVDVKVCAVDQTWSGLKMMIRKELR